MDFEQLRKDMENCTDGPLRKVDMYDYGWSLDTDGENTATCIGDASGPILIIGVESAFGRDEFIDAWERLILSLPDLERIALAAEKYRKADEAFGTTKTPADAYRVSREITEARAELFALLTSKDAT